MRVYGVEADGKFREYVATPFQSDHEEAILEDWLEENPDGILEDGTLLIIGRQITTNLNTTIDLLALDRGGDVVVIELKRDRTPRETLAQALEYASFAGRLDTGQLETLLREYMSDESLALAEYHRKHFDLSPDEAVAFNKDQRIVIVGQRVSNEIRQTALFLRSKGIRITCIEFSFFRTNEGKKLLSQEIVVGSELERPSRVSSGARPVISPEAFIQSLDKNGKTVFEKVLAFAQARKMPIHWGTKGFSLNVDVNGMHVPIFYCYPPSSVYKQSVYTALKGQGGFKMKAAVPDEEIKTLWDRGKATGLFKTAGHDLKCHINRAFTDAETGKLLSWGEELVAAITEHGLKE